MSIRRIYRPKRARLRADDHHPPRNGGDRPPAQAAAESPAIMLGGAVVTAEYASKLGCHYAKDAKASVEVARQILG